ncbi:type III-A CRISPR-associated RAMP protein Csm5 [Methanotorris formicicus]|uniref:CRISPR system Cms protein Csm5 n=1 Tax=Methanotorris formicicus Mc-S-70 TaxID=647171 RepID=H1KYS7_9EURY|nr:type III-A CRISPR-associated RAMP protein Csm5 [Methanotorris formicicus]EHP86824.1 CRISPR-associated RAMP protein, Csm5 family [Methanotorris formicicus Mc-S-70]
MEVKCNTITPIFIGCGEEYTQLDYYIEENKAKIVDLEKAMMDLDDLEKINHLSKLITSYINNNRLESNAKELLKSIGIDVKDYVVREVNCEIESHRSIRVKKFINQRGFPYIPGSSIKGAIRTAYIFDYYDDEKRINELIKILRDKNIKPWEKGDAVVKNAISRNIQSDFFKYLIVSDSGFLDGKFKFIMTKRWNTKKGKFEVPIALEGFMDKNEFDLRIIIKDEFIKEIFKKTERNYKEMDEKEKFDELKRICNKLTETIIDFELNRDNPEILETFYERLKNQLNDGICLNVGFGGGFLAKTIYLLLWKYDKDGRKGYLKLMKKIFKNERNRNLRESWNRAYSYYDFPKTKTVYVKNGRIVSPLGWIKINY